MTVYSFDKSIVYCRVTRQYAYSLDGRLIDFAPTYHDAEVALDDYIHTLLMGGLLTADGTRLPAAVAAPSAYQNGAAL